MDKLSIINKLKKLKVLSERGIDGEANNARLLLEKLSLNSGISLAELEDEDFEQEVEKFEIKVSSKWDEKRIFEHCYYRYFNTNSISYWEVSKSVFKIECTKADFIGFSVFYGFHKDKFRAEQERFRRLFVSSYISKHNLYSDIEVESDEPSTLSDKEVMDILNIRNSLDDETIGINKLLEDSTNS